MKERIHWVDIAKGIGILFVCLSHHAFNTVGLWISVFHMPLFFFLSGYCFHGGQEDFSQEILRKAYRLLAIYFSYGILKWTFSVLYSLAAGQLSLQPESFFGIFLILPFDPWSNPIWFFPCLFVANLMFSAIIRMLRRFAVPHIPSVLFLFFTGLAVATWYTLGCRLIWLPWYADVSIYLLPHMALGYLLSRLSLFEKLLRRPPAVRFSVAVFSAIIAYGLFLLLHPTASSYVSYKIRLLDDFIPILLCGAAGTIMIVTISIALTHFRPLEYIGQNSAVYYLTQWKIAGFLYGFQPIYRIFQSYWLSLLAPVLLSALFCVPICWVLNRFFPFFIGKKKFTRFQHT